MKSEIKKGSDISLETLFKRFEAMDNFYVEAGYLSPVPHPESDLTLPEIAYIQQYGSEHHKIPDRPFITDGAVLSVPEIQKAIPHFMRNYLLTNKGIAAFEPIAKVSRESIAKAIALQKFVPLSPVTLKLREDRGNKSTHILIDTGYLINGVESKVKRSRRKK